MADTSTTQASPPPAPPAGTGTVATSASTSAAPPTEPETEEAPQLETDDEAYVSSFSLVFYATLKVLIFVPTGNRGWCLNRRAAVRLHPRSSFWFGRPWLTATSSNYSASVTSSVVDYPVEYGRRYHAYRPGSYKFPNDEFEMDRLDLAHAMMVKAIGSKLYLAPLEKEKIHDILDIGTGTGICTNSQKICRAVEMGDIFHNAEIIGNDLSAIQPEWTPPNVKFEIDDVESPWIDKKYDYIMCRYMAASIKDWPKLVKNIFDHLNPGGWAEFQEMNSEYYSNDGSYNESHATYKWNQTFVNACSVMGRDACPAPKIRTWVHDAGFENISAKRIKSPLGPWPKDPFFKDLGMMNLCLTLDGLEAFSLKLFCDVLGREKDEVLVELAGVRSELKKGEFHALFDL
ncbi:umta methyltransferase family protein [Colletotrichum musicola]|uniref:Umta methyltransferase family protein n=1 Tax=Colletotrichum musicola TaxID=2175873 RepID=A0A8H6KLM2_9PEZI|nr:umta methyltransferase family protein [Colletotrichum musicola]